MRRLLLATFVVVAVSDCSQTLDQRMARAAERINANKPHYVESARAEGDKLIVRLSVPPSSFTADEIARMTTAGLCGLDDVRAVVKRGGSFRFEVTTGFMAAASEVDRCPDS